MLRRLIATALFIGEIASGITVPSQAQEMRITCYTSKSTAYTFSGQLVHEGGCASNVENLGKMAFIYNSNFEFIGMYECNDIGSNYCLKNGTALDIWQPSLDECYEFIGKNGDYAYVIFIDAEG